jgi:uncharacterized membrane protein
MRWGSHLIFALIVGAILIGIWEIYTNSNLGDELQRTFPGTDVGTILALLLLVALVLWWRASRG